MGRGRGNRLTGRKISFEEKSKMGWERPLAGLEPRAGQVGNYYGFSFHYVDKVGFAPQG